MIKDISTSRDSCLTELMSVWEDSVRATHDFLTENDIDNLKPLVMSALKEIPKLYSVQTQQEIDGFMGIDGDKMEMLFIRDSKRGHGLGKSLLLHGIQTLNIKYIDVNEQNPQARGFYEHFGFTVYKRSEYDAQGNHFPILHMKSLL